MPGPRNPSAWPLRNRRLRGRLAATAHAAGRRALAVRGARRQLRNSRGADDPLARFALRTHVRRVPEGALPRCLRHVLAIRNVFASPIGMAQATGRRTTDSGLSSARAATNRAETKPAPARVRHSGPRTERLRSGRPESPLPAERLPPRGHGARALRVFNPSLRAACIRSAEMSRDECRWSRYRRDGRSIRRKAFRAHRSLPRFPGARGTRKCQADFPCRGGSAEEYRAVSTRSESGARTVSVSRHPAQTLRWRKSAA